MLVLLVVGAAYSFFSRAAVDSYLVSLLAFFMSASWAYFFLTYFRLKALRNYFTQKLTLSLALFPFVLFVLIGLFGVTEENLLPLAYTLITIYVVTGKLTSRSGHDRYLVWSAYLAMVVWSVAPLVSMVHPAWSEVGRLTFEGSLILMSTCFVWGNILEGRREHRIFQEHLRSYGTVLPTREEALEQERLLDSIYESIKAYKSKHAGTPIEEVLDDDDESEDEDNGPAITKRERQVAQLLLTGLNAKEIAQTLDIAYPTTKRHLSNLYAKYRVAGERELVKRLRETGLE